MAQAEQNITKLYGDAVANAAKIAQQTQANLGGLGQSAQQRMESVSQNTGGTSEGLRQAAVMPQAVLGNAQAQAGARGDILQQYLNAVGPAVAASAGAQERASGSAAAAQKQLGQAQIQAAREQAAARSGGGAGGMTPSQTLNMLEYFDNLAGEETGARQMLEAELADQYASRRLPGGGFTIPGMTDEEGGAMRVPGRQAVGGLRKQYLNRAAELAGGEEAGAQLIDDILQQQRDIYETTYGLGGGRAQAQQREPEPDFLSGIAENLGFGAAMGGASRMARPLTTGSSLAGLSRTPVKGGLLSAIVQAILQPTLTAPGDQEGDPIRRYWPGGPEVGGQ